jgi:hypothetical protein
MTDESADQNGQFFTKHGDLDLPTPKNEGGPWRPHRPSFDLPQMRARLKF